MARFRTRYHLIDHENGHVTELGKHFVLNPAANFADYIGMLVIADNVEPEMAADLREHLAFIDGFPDRTLSKYGLECLPWIKHPAVKPAVDAYIRKHGIFVPGGSDRGKPE